MKRRSEAEIKKSWRHLLNLSILFIVMGVFLAVLTTVSMLSPKPDESEYHYETVAVEEADLRDADFSRHSNYIWFITTAEGEEFRVVGDTVCGVLSEKLVKGSIAEIKWIEKGLFFKRKLVSEVTVEGVKVVVPDEIKPFEWVVVYIICLISIALGIGFFFFYRSYVNHEIEYNKKRDERIIKKYGELKR